MKRCSFSASALKFVFIIFLASCSQDDSVDLPSTEQPDREVDLTDDESIEAYWVAVADTPFRLNRLYLEDSAMIGAMCPFSSVPQPCDSAYFRNLYTKLDDCRKDDLYTFNYSHTILELINHDRDLVCSTEEVNSPFEIATISLLSDRAMGELTFDITNGAQAVNRFFGFQLTQAPTATYQRMNWEFTHLSKDSINIRGEFTHPTPKPDISIQFLPL